MAVVAQLVEPRVVISVVVGSSPISRPNVFSSLSLFFKFTALFAVFLVPIRFSFYLFYYLYCRFGQFFRV